MSRSRSRPKLNLPLPAPQGELDGMIEQLDAMLEGAGFFFPPDKVPTTKRALRTLADQAGLVQPGSAHPARRLVGARQSATARLTFFLLSLQM